MKINSLAAFTPVPEFAARTDTGFRHAGSEPATVFVVDDYEGTRLSLKWLLESAGTPVEAFASGQEFLAEYRNRPGCLVADLGFRGRQGLALLEELRARDIALPVIVLDANGDDCGAALAMAAGAADYLRKPFRDVALLRSIEEALRRKRCAFLPT